MNLVLVGRIVGIYALIFGVTLVGPVLVGLWYREAEVVHFLWPMVGSLAGGAFLWLIGRRHARELSVGDGYLVVALFWVLLSILGAWPLMNGFGLSPVDALFESTSGITTTGATVIAGLDSMPRSLLFYRQQLQWFGGMGLIVLGVAVMPMLGIGGMQLYRAEAPGPLKEEKLTPRLTQTARALWMIYFTLTLACAGGYWLAGMTPFDAVSHSLSTVSTGGFSTHDASMGHFASPAVEAVAVVFMLLAAINFGVHYLVWLDRNPLHYLRDTEARTFLGFVLGMVLLVGLILYVEGPYDQVHASLRDAAFEVVSIVTSTGFGTVDFAHWPDFLPLLLIYISFVGGCGGSTAGGMKVLRVLLMVKQGAQEVRQLIHPHAILPLRLGRRIVDPRLARSVWGFFALYTFAVATLTLLMIHAGLAPLDAFSAVATCLNNLGPGLGEVALTFQTVSDTGKLLGVVAMLLGRLEILTILVILSPAFWRR
ncbi:TrkH family potassium uptake protein [Thiocapsa marina]|jgi:trk system potassium uptake protein TrkH|uniref:Trk system potassium uptake protein n=1 Tax=Thiocapsa marina 5811 TaxID=768671 RepID=F9UBB5_9GAMM|nr:TrkH family potassium uptake protein [Thiocapsa marina]EGV18233.1 potassium uptake protein, TrkH family [Thiocapsa marina 5811]